MQDAGTVGSVQWLARRAQTRGRECWKVPLVPQSQGTAVPVPTSGSHPALEEACQHPGPPRKAGRPAVSGWPGCRSRLCHEQLQPSCISMETANRCDIFSLLTVPHSSRLKPPGWLETRNQLRLVITRFNCLERREGAWERPKKRRQARGNAPRWTGGLCQEPPVSPSPGRGGFGVGRSREVTGVTICYKCQDRSAWLRSAGEGALGARGVWLHRAQGGP